MSKERARRRAAREAQRARAREREERRAARAARRRALIAKITPRRVRAARQRGVLARRRRAQNAVVVLGFLLLQALAWLGWGSWTVSLATLVVSLLLLPVIVTLVFDRRTSR